MKSLVLKDLFNIGHNMKSMALMLLFFLFLFVPSTGVTSYIIVSAALCAAMIITTFSFDEMSSWTAYAMIMPISKKELVLSKFLVLFIFSGIGVVSGILFGTIGGIAAHKISLNNMDDIFITLATGGIALVFAIIIGSISIPLILQFGAEKARMMTLVSFLIPISIAWGIYKLLELVGVVFTDKIIIGLLCSSPIFTIVLTYIMYQISCAIFAKKELLS